MYIKILDPEGQNLGIQFTISNSTRTCVRVPRQPCQFHPDLCHPLLFQLYTKI